MDKKKPYSRRENDEVVLPEEVVWDSKTLLGRDVLADKVVEPFEILSKNKKINEDKIIERLVPDLELVYMDIGQAKGKFGGGKRKVPKQTQKITKEGGVMSFSVMVICGNKSGFLGLGQGKAGDTVAAKNKAETKAKKNIIMIRRGAGSWDSFGAGPHTIPFAVEGKCSSVRVRLIPAPKGTGLVAEAQIKKMLELCGIKDIWSEVFGKTKSKINLIKATFNALENLQKMRLTKFTAQNRSLMEGDKDEKF